MNLTQEQLAFIEAVKSGTESIRLEAVAGCGKTTTVVAAANALAGRQSALALAFNSKNAKELGEKMPPNVECRTLNSLGHAAWQQHLRKRLRVDARKVGTLASEVIKASGLSNPQDKEDTLWRDVLDLVGKAKSEGLVPSSADAPSPGFIQDTDEEWEGLASRHNIDVDKRTIPVARKVLALSIQLALDGQIDFDDQLYMTTFWNARLQRFPIVIVDEAQDLSELQQELVSRSVQSGGRVIAVGDSHQAIYGFRGALTDSMDRFQSRFDMRRMGLTCSFRCPTRLVHEARKFVPHITAAPGAITGELIHYPDRWDTEDIKPGSAILCRNLAPLFVLGYRMIRAGIGAQLLGGDLSAGFKKIVSKFHSNTTDGLINEIAAWKEAEVEKAKARSDLEAIARVEDRAEALTSITIHALATSAGELQRILEQLFNSKGTIQLATIHRAKGAEWDVVYWLDRFRCPAKFARKAVENDPEGCAWMMEQEHNLEYIALTRAKRELHFIEMDKLGEPDLLAEEVA